MTDLNNATRRRFLKVGATLATLPVLGFSGAALAAKNDSLRKALSYQTSPSDGKSCSNCINYQAAAKGCSLFPGDTEIAPTGYCTGYVVKPKG